MFDIGFTELLLFTAIALIVLGPEKLPQAVRTAGKYYAKIRRTISTIQAEMEAELDLAETRQQLQKELEKIKQAETDMKREMAQLRGSIAQFEQTQNQQTAQALSPSQPITQAQENTSSLHRLSPQVTNTVSQTEDNDTPPEAVTVQPVYSTKPWENMWFRLGEYDKARRLPPAPFLPSYQADPLLYTSPTVSTDTARLSQEMLSQETQENNSWG
ncbi:Sec-independent protein translocase protein TatB [Psychrobacter sp. I-STPA6b]|uniref:Sec-independent protein translocase protein TatB n=1 Tax=Psychrobacter sp. I-STPA6b TaxID=2585718 RepID=UPI001D0CAC27|nr:Sec-independent protein translocase protein TatB [Psychrobacter sp. I-STPA6b]